MAKIIFDQVRRLYLVGLGPAFIIGLMLTRFEVRQYFIIRQEVIVRHDVIFAIFVVPIIRIVFTRLDILTETYVCRLST